MKIKSVTIEGMHNVVNKTYTINDLTYIHGPNGAGKSTVLQAIQLALLGYISGTNKTKEAIFRHACNHTMAVTLQLDDDGRPVTVRRVWTGTKSGISSSVDVIPSIYDMQKIVADIELPIFNFNEFINMTANKLKDWFIDFLPSADVSTNWEEKLTEAAETSGVSEVDTELVETCAAEIKKYGLKGTDEVRKANEYFKSALSFKKKELERAQSTIQSLIYYDDVTEDMSEAEIAAKISSLEGKRKERDNAANAARRNDAIKQQLAQYSVLVAATPEDDERYKEAEAQLTEATEEVNRARARDAELEAVRQKIQEEKYALNDIISTNRATISIRQNIIETGGVCPFTKATCESVQPLIEQYKQEVATSEATIKETYDKMTELDEKAKSVSAEIAALSQTVRVCEMRKQSAMNAISQIKVEYSKKQTLEAQLEDVKEIPYQDIDFDSEIKKLKDIQVKYEANKRYSAMIDTLTAQKFTIDQEILVYKAWINLTGVNGLQNDAGAATPFITLAAQMNKYIQAVFGETVSSRFNLEARANSFSFGIERNGAYIPFNLLSSGEKCMYTLALMMSLADVSASPLKLVMIDDLLDHLDDVNINKMFESLAKESSIQMIFAGVKPVKGDFVTEVK